MLKKFFLTLLGTIAGVWISFGLLFVVIIFMGVAAGFRDGNQKTEIKKHSVLKIDLAGEITERPTNNDFLAALTDNEYQELALNEIVSAIRTAADDKKIDGIFINTTGSLAGISSRLDIRQALLDFKRSGKWTIAYGDSYAQGDYFIASAADTIIVNPVGAVDIHGLASTTYMYKGLMDKLGVKMQIVKVGTYKSAVEPYIMTEISPANALQQERFLGSIWGTITSEIAGSRGVTPATVNQWADSLVFCADPDYYWQNKIVTGLAYRDKVTAMLKEMTGTDKLREVSVKDYVAANGLQFSKSAKTKIAVLYAEGEISDAGKKGIVGPKMVKEIEKLIEDDDNAALILRVNSPGGSAFASEQIWWALERYKKTGRPFYVSMGDLAASGGYYISCGADKIFAQPVTLTGSIGIFGMIPDFSGLLEDKLGVTQSTVKTNPNATFISVTQPMSEYEKQAMQRTVNRGYETFTWRVAQGRELNIDSVKAIAEGRVWAGKDALEIGLVDELGNLNDAIAAIAAELGAEKYCVEEYPRLKTGFWEMLEDMDYTDFASILMRRSVVPAGLDAERRIEEIKNWNHIQARMPEVELR